jgi:competence protein ComEC
MRGNILVFVLGAWLLQQQAALPNLAWAWALLPLLLAWRLPQNGGFALKWTRELLFKSLFLAAGFFWAASIAQVRLADALPTDWEGKDIQLTGVVAALPQESERGSRFEFDVEKVATPGAVVPRHVQLSWYAFGYRESPTPDARPAIVHAGERWQLTVRLKRPHGNANPDGFDFEAWMLERNVRATGYVRKEDTNRRLDALVVRPGYLVEHARESIAERFQQVLGNRPYLPVLKALAIGDQSAIPQEQWLVFLRTGVNHLVSISGLHVTMVAGLLFSLTYWLWRRSHRLTQRLPARKAAAVAGALTALAYVLLAGFAVPAQRTLYMLAVVAIALWLGRIASASRVLSLALLTVVLLDPWAVLAPGFWLSFGAVAVMLYVSVGRVSRPHWLAEAAHVQWAVTLGLAPLLLALFQQASIISPIANAFAIPVISLVVVPLTLLGAVPPLGFLLLLAHEIMRWCMWLLTWLSSLPDAVWQQHAPPTWTVLAALLGIVWLLLPRGFPARWLGAVPLLPLFLVLPPQPAGGALWLDVLDVGQGLAVVVRTEHHALLYDTGPRFSNEADSGNRILLPYLRAAGVRRLDGLIVSHDDADHSGGAVSVLDGIPTGWLASSLPQLHPAQLHAARKLRCYAGQTWTWDGVRFDMLHPTLASYAEQGLKDNARGCVLKITSRYGSALLPADIERVSEEELLHRAPQSLPATVLIAPHHGSKTSSTEEFIRQVNPAVTIFTVGYRNRFGHPKEAVVQRYEAQGSRLYRTDRSGAVQLRFADARGVTVQGWREVERRYWREGGQ